MEAALRLVAEIDALDRLVASEIAFDALVTELPKVFAPGASGLAPVIRYGA